jgi:hypothetical protein
VAAPDRRRRARTLVVAALVALLAVVLMGRGAGAQACFPFCDSTTSTRATASTVEVTPTTEEDVTTTTEDERTNTTEDDTDDTRERTTTTQERVTTTVLQVTTSVDLLIPGDGTEGAESTTTTEKAKVTGSSGGLSDNQLVVLIVTGLTVFGGAIALLTWRYWQATQPVEVPNEPAGRGSRPAPRTHRSVFLDP